METIRPTLDIETDLAQGLAWVEKEYGGLVPPVYFSTSYCRDPQGEFPGGHSYSRDQNPSFDQTEALLAKLELGEEALLFSSGMAAATTIFDTLERGAHVICPQTMYFTIRMWLKTMDRLGKIRLSLVAGQSAEELEKVLEPGITKLVWIETPANPAGEIIDIKAWSKLAHDAGAVVVADNTLASPILCQPLSLGVDIVMHSATKQLNGHGDVLAGALICKKKDEIWEKVCFERAYRGAVASPMSSWLLLRGMRTLALRVNRSADSAFKLAQYLANHPKIEDVYYPGLSTHPGHDIAKKQMKGGFGYVIAMVIKGGTEALNLFFERLRVFSHASSLGGVESLVERRGQIEGSEGGLSQHLIRLSIGIEACTDLQKDLEQALS